MEKKMTAIQRSAQALGRRRTPKKADASRANGRKGGRPINPNSARQLRLCSEVGGEEL